MQIQTELYVAITTYLVYKFTYQNIIKITYVYFSAFSDPLTFHVR